MFIINALIKTAKILKLEFTQTEKKLSNEELLPKLRTNVHVLEKRTNEERTDFFRMANTHKFYLEAKKRSILSKDEIAWCEKVLFGKIKNEKSLKIKDVNAIDIITKNRRSSRLWEKTKISNEAFEELINIAKWAPSSCNRQPWHFILTRDDKKIKLIYSIKKQKFIEKAPNCIIALVNTKAWSNENSFKYFSGLDIGAAIQTLLLKAEAMNLGACWVNWYPDSISLKDRKKIRKEFNILENYEIISIIPIGHAKEKPSPPGRRKTDEIIDYEEMKK